MNYLSVNEEILLLAIVRLKDNAYPVSIRDIVKKMTGKDLVYGTLYNSLENLLKKGYINSEKGTPTSERGGKSKIFFSLSDHGVECLKNTIEFHKNIWEETDIITNKHQS